MSRSIIKVFLGLAISAAVILWMLAELDWQEVGYTLLNLKLWALIPAFFVMIFHFYLRALRWKALLPSSEGLPNKVVFDGVMIGNFATFVLPLRAGEFIRPFFLSRQSEASFPSCFASVVVERFFDLSMVIISFLIMTLFVSNLGPQLLGGAVLLGILAVALFLLMVLGSFYPALVLKVAELFIRPLPEKIRLWISSTLSEFLRGAAQLKSGKRFLRVSLLTVGVWFSNYLLHYVLIFLLPIEPSLLLAVSISIITALAVAAPSAPGFIGILQGATISAFALFGESYELATAYSLVNHLMQYIFYIVYGIYILGHYGLTLGELRSRKGA